MGYGTPFHPNGLMGVAIIGGTIFHFAFHRVDFSRFRNTRFFSVFIGICLLSLLNTGPYIMEGIGVTLRLVTAFAIYLVLIYKLDSINKVKWVIGVVIAAQAIYTLGGFLNYQGATGLAFTDETIRLGHSGIGIRMAYIATLCLVLLLSSKSKSGQLAFGLLTFLFFLGMYFTFGRSGWIGFVIALILLSILKYQRLLFILPLLLILGISLVPGVSQRFSNLSDSYTMNQRIGLWQTAINIYPDHLSGVGFGVGRYVVGDYLGEYPWMIHNDYVSVLLDTGILGLWVFLLWHLQWLLVLFKVFKNAELEFEKTFALGVFTVFATLLVMRVTDNILLDSFDMYPICALVAAAVSIPRIRSTETANIKSTAQKEMNE